MVLLDWESQRLSNVVLEQLSARSSTLSTVVLPHIFLFPLTGDVPLQKVKFTTILEWEYINNFKVLQEAFTKHSIDKAIPVQRLIKLKFQDNLEFLQWMRRFWEGKGGSIPGYNAVERRSGAGVILSSRTDGNHFIT